MLFAVGGASVLVRPPGRGEWSVITDMESLGTLGGQWEVSGQEVASEDPADGNRTIFHKVGLTPGPMQLVMGLNVADEGQAALWEAFASLDDAEFRIELPNGAWRQFSALVIGLGEVLDVATDAARLQASLQINSEVEKGP